VVRYFFLGSLSAAGHAGRFQQLCVIEIVGGCCVKAFGRFRRLCVIEIVGGCCVKANDKMRELCYLQCHVSVLRFFSCFHLG
jgi:hypothetical protein